MRICRSLQTRRAKTPFSKTRMEAYHKKIPSGENGFYDEENDLMEKNLPLESWNVMVKLSRIKDYS